MDHTEKKLSLCSIYSSSLERSSNWKTSIMLTLLGNDTHLPLPLCSFKGYPLDFIAYGFTPLTRCVYDRRHAALEQLLHAGASVDFEDGNGRTPLMTAAFRADIDSCYILLNHGANVNAKIGSNTALVHASCNGAYEVACLLLQHGARPCDTRNLWDNFGDSAFASAIAWNHCNVVERFVTYFNERDIKLPLELLIKLAVERSSEDCAIIFLEQGLYLNHKSLQTISLFHMAAEKGQIKLMSLLVELDPQFLQEEWLIQKKIPEELQKQKSYTFWLMEYRKHVPSLQKVCKSSILSQLVCYYKPKIAELPLPRSLREYLCLLESTYNQVDC